MIITAKHHQRVEEVSAASRQVDELDAAQKKPHQLSPLVDDIIFLFSPNFGAALPTPVT